MAEVREIGVVGAGFMGSGIAETAARAGLRVRVYEPSDETAREIQEFVRDQHSKYAYPREVEFVDDLPKTLTGKIRRIELRQRELEAAQATGSS